MERTWREARCRPEEDRHRGSQPQRSGDAAAPATSRRPGDQGPGRAGEALRRAEGADQRGRAPPANEPRHQPSPQRSGDAAAAVPDDEPRRAGERSERQSARPSRGRQCRKTPQESPEAASPKDIPRQRGSREQRALRPIPERSRGPLAHSEVKPFRRE